MSNLFIKETYVNLTEGYSFGDSGGYFETWTHDKGKLFKSLQQEYGRCASKVYVDQLQVNGQMAAIQVGWTFHKKMQYEDSKDTFIREVWVSIKENGE